jgi:hypothetical protein
MPEEKADRPLHQQQVQKYVDYIADELRQNHPELLPLSRPKGTNCIWKSMFATSRWNS